MTLAAGMPPRQLSHSTTNPAVYQIPVHSMMVQSGGNIISSGDLIAMPPRYDTLCKDPPPYNELFNEGQSDVMMEISSHASPIAGVISHRMTPPSLQQQQQQQQPRLSASMVTCETDNELMASGNSWNRSRNLMPFIVHSLDGRTVFNSKTISSIKIAARKSHN